MNKNGMEIVIGVLIKYTGDDIKAVIPDTVKIIGEKAFADSLVEEVVLPDSVTSIADCAFENCTSLTSTKIPDSVTSIGENAFEGCASLKQE